ncbi:MAG: hypothetical protein M0Q38_05760 [Bacteroidales bacterium]|nr:hypothetical protein [Bacteroidales bacterium]
MVKRVTPAVGQENETKGFTRHGRWLRFAFAATTQQCNNNNHQRHNDDVEIAFHDP